LLAFASDPKSVALDGKPGKNSPFTKALLNHLEDAGVSIDIVMNRVRAEVWSETKNKQMLWVNTSIIGEFVLNPQVAPLPHPQMAPLPQTWHEAASVTPAITQETGFGIRPNMPTPAKTIRPISMPILAASMPAWRRTELPGSVCAKFRRPTGKRRPGRFIRSSES